MESLLLATLNLSQKNNTAPIFREVVEKIPKFVTPNKFVEECIQRFYERQRIMTKSDTGKKPTHGTFFEYTIGECLIQKNLTPVYYQATLELLPADKFDWILYNKTSPVLIS